MKTTILFYPMVLGAYLFVLFGGSPKRAGQFIAKYGINISPERPRRQWTHYTELMASNESVVDALGQKVALVREVRQVRGGVEVRFLVPIHKMGGTLGAAAIANASRPDVVIAQAFISGGSVIKG